MQLYQVTIIATAVLVLAGCAGVSTDGLSANVTGGINGTTTGVDGKDINYNLGTSVNWAPKKQPPPPNPAP
jgi:hypothetical protein